jgi:hypothetical protein
MIHPLCLMMTTENFIFLFSLARMGSRKKVHAFVRVKPTDEFAHEMIKYGDDNKVSVVCFLSPSWAFLCMSGVTLFPNNCLRTKMELVNVQVDSRSIKSKPRPHSAMNEEPMFNRLLIILLLIKFTLTLHFPTVVKFW